MILHRLLPDPGDVEIRPGRFCSLSPTPFRSMTAATRRLSMMTDGHAWPAPPQDFGKPKHFGSKEP